MIDLATVEALRDLGMDDGEIAAELGVPELAVLGTRRPRVVRRVEGVPREAVALLDRRRSPSILDEPGYLDEFRDEEVDLEALLAAEMPRSGTACSLVFAGGGRSTRAGVARRLAQKIAEQQGHVWWHLTASQRVKYARLAALVVVALEDLAAEGAAPGARIEERIERAARR